MLYCSAIIANHICWLNCAERVPRDRTQIHIASCVITNFVVVQFNVYTHEHFFVYSHSAVRCVGLHEKRMLHPFEHTAPVSAHALLAFRLRSRKHTHAVMPSKHTNAFIVSIHLYVCTLNTYARPRATAAAVGRRFPFIALRFGVNVCTHQHRKNNRSRRDRTKRVQRNTPARWVILTGSTHASLIQHRVDGGLFAGRLRENVPESV